MVFLGQVSICIGSYFYIGSSLGCGPRDALMIALGKRMPKVPIGVTRGLLEGSVLIIGWLLGAKVGVGTAVYVLGIGLVLQFTFKLLRFDVKSIVHESIADTVKEINLLLSHSQNNIVVTIKTYSLYGVRRGEKDTLFSDKKID